MSLDILHLVLVRPVEDRVDLEDAGVMTLYQRHTVSVGSLLAAHSGEPNRCPPQRLFQRSHFIVRAASVGVLTIKLRRRKYLGPKIVKIQS